MGVLVGKKAPDFNCKAVVGTRMIDHFTLSAFKGKYVVLFFYPLDFTFVCPTELHAFQEELASFKQLNAEVIGCSVDSVFFPFSMVRNSSSKGRDSRDPISFIS